ncbi:hypothetical protein K402DRAFT_398529 [Aulographum hederae CBS 113979]|uniref:Uncharacterized protein n=1 Tax=Aulographum hederae CBS 113979 TaxID=1176131 RepID=A0A6G1GKS0_9PEZI|nr:hypothetical protein K402DRAFT_398529 [Aulographum hederae CBS 113979]
MYLTHLIYPAVLFKAVILLHAVVDPQSNSIFTSLAIIGIGCAYCASAITFHSIRSIDIETEGE